MLSNIISKMTSDVTAALVSNNLLIGQDFATFYDSWQKSVHREASAHIHRGAILLFPSRTQHSRLRSHC
jgi:hypothetical protein